VKGVRPWRNPIIEVQFGIQSVDTREPSELNTRRLFISLIRNYKSLEKLSTNLVSTHEPSDAVPVR